MASWISGNTVRAQRTFLYLYFWLIRPVLRTVHTASSLLHFDNTAVINIEVMHIKQQLYNSLIWTKAIHDTWVRY